MPNEKGNPTPAERDERFSIPLDPDVFLEGLLAVDPVEIAKGQTWAGKVSGDTVTVVGPVPKRDDAWYVRTPDGDVEAVTATSLLAGYHLTE